MTILCTQLDEWNQLRQNYHGKTVGFVPTMGNFHRGHQSLFARSRNENAVTVVTVFVNPTQFNKAEDFATYPRTLEHDLALAAEEGVDIVLAPAASALYPDAYSFRVSEHKDSLDLEGSHRPGHFTGMLTIVLKLLQIVRADRAYFGEKDYQQLQLVTGLARAFFVPTQIVPCPTVRSSSGLALSSRNSRLSPEDLRRAAIFPELLASALPCAEVEARLVEQGFSVDYIADIESRRFGAVHLSGVRLIDNIAR